MNLRLKYFRNYWLQKRWLLKSLKSLTSEQISVICLNLHGTYYPIFPWSGINWAGKTALVRSKILGLFVNTLTAEYMYFGRNMKTLTQQVQTPLFLKQKTFSGYFYCLSEIYMKWRTFSKKRKVFSLSISEIIDSRCLGYLSAWKALLQNSFRLIRGDYG